MAKMIMSRHVSKTCLSVRYLIINDNLSPTDVSEASFTAATGAQCQRTTVFQKTPLDGVTSDPLLYPFAPVSNFITATLTSTNGIISLSYSYSTHPQL